MSDPGLLKEFPEITALLPQAGGNGEQPAAADPTLAGLDAMTDLALDDGRPQGQGQLKVRHRLAGAAMLVPVLSGLLPSVGRPRCHC